MIAINLKYFFASLFFQSFRFVLFAFSISLVVGFPNIEDHHADQTEISKTETGTGKPDSHDAGEKPALSVEPYMDDDGRICQVKHSKII